MMPGLNKNDYNKFIFVEGDDDFHFLCHFLNGESRKDIYVEKIDGKSKLKLALKAYLKLDAFAQKQFIAVIVDADLSFNDTQKSVIQIFKDVGLPTPKEHGEIANSGDISAAFFIMPGKNKNGAIEDLIMDYTSTKEISKYVDTFFTGLKSDESSIKMIDVDYGYPTNDKKAKVQVFLSSHADSDTRIGTSIQKKIIDTKHVCFDEIRDFVKKI